MNILKQVDKLYSELEKDARMVYKQLYFDRYAEMYLFLKGKKKLTRNEQDTIEELAEMYVAGLLSEPNPNTGYAFDAETLRKRDRAKEAMISKTYIIQRMVELDKATRFWVQQTGFYADFTSQGAELQALKDNGVKRVIRHEHHDKRVCAECKKADGEIYEITKVPPLPHPRCRRWFTPV